MTEDFYFKTTYNGTDYDPTIYYAHKHGKIYQVVVEKGNYTATVDYTLEEVVEYFVKKEWIVVFNGNGENV